jgi:hypothetical protein
MEITVFYAWQSDRPGSVNRHLIRKAAEAACKRISEDTSNHWAVRLDSDTKGEAGMCDIPNTILKKIKACDIFLADLTFVSPTEGNPEKLIPNPNVVFELGFAARHHRFGALIGVINEAFGKVERQVFDIKRRASLKYNTDTAKTNKDREKIEENLSQELEAVIRTTIETVVVPRRERTSASAQDAAEEARVAFANRVLSGDFYGFNQLPAVLTSIQFPLLQAQDYEAAHDKVGDFFGLTPQVVEQAVIWQENSYIAELCLSGHLFHAFGGDYRSVQNQFAFNARATGETHTDHFLPAVPMQMNAVRHITLLCHFLHRSEIKPPWRIGISLVGAKGFGLLYPSGESGKRPCPTDDVHLPILRVTRFTDVDDGRKVGNLLYGAFGQLLRCFGEQYNLCYNSDKTWNQRVS